MARHRSITRRRLLQQGTKLTGSVLAAPYMLTSQALGAPGVPAASERLTLGFIGVGGMGSGHLGFYVDHTDTRILAVADVNTQHRNRALKRAGTDAKGYNDYRELLARDDIDAVVIATPDHWHCKTAVDACRAGKDVYCEKPLSLTIREAREMAKAARRNATVFQTGSQQRSDPKFRLACEVVRSGRIGQLQRVRAAVGGGPTCPPQKPEPVPDWLDWNFWLGPAPWAEYTPKRASPDFRWIYDYSGGKMTDWGAHHNDIAQWGIGASHSGPVRTEPISVTFPKEGLFNTAVTFEVKYTYANGVELTTTSDGNDIHFQGTAGWVKVNRGRIEASNPDILREPLGAGDVHLYKSPGHGQDWMACIKTRKRPICDVEIGCRSATVCHLGNIALRTGKTIEWNPEKEEVTNDPSLNRWLARPYRAPWRI